MAWNSGQSLKGQRGAQILFGARDPSASDGFDGDGWINTSNGHLFAQKSNGAWPTTYATLAAVGNVFYSGSQAPGPTTPGNVGDIFYVTTTSTFYQQTSTGWGSLGSVAGTNGTNGSQITFTNAPPGATYGAVGDFAYYPATQTFYSKTSTGWAALGSVTGAKGDQGLAGTPGTAVRYGSGSPTTSNPTTQADGDFYINNATPSAPVLYGPRASGTWPSSGITLVGPQGIAGTTPPGLYSGSGAPTTSNPSGAALGSYYVRNDVTPLTLYGPLVSGGWPTTGVSMSGSQIYYGTGAPTTQGNVNDYYFDTTAGAVKLYPAKTSSGWTASPVSLTGPQGPQGYSSLTTQAAVVNAQTYFAATVSSTPTTLPIANTTAPLIYFPFQSSALMGLNVVNNGVAVTANLVDLTASSTAASISIAPGNFTASYTANQYPLIANHNYQWQITGSGSANLVFSPTYLSAAAGTTNIIGTWSGFSTAQGTTFSGTANYPGPFGRNGTSGTCRSIPTNSAKALHSAVGYYSASTTGAAAASVTCNVLAYNSGNGSTSTIASFSLPNTGAPTVYQPTSPISIASGLTIYSSITGSGTGFVTFDLNLIG